MAWDRNRDAAQYEAARFLEQLHSPLWWVLWGPASRCFWAFHLGPHRVAPLRATTPRLLDEAIRATGCELRSFRPLRP